MCAVSVEMDHTIEKTRPASGRKEPLAAVPNSRTSYDTQEYDLTGVLFHLGNAAVNGAHTFTKPYEPFILGWCQCEWVDEGGGRPCVLVG